MIVCFMQGQFAIVIIRTYMIPCVWPHNIYNQCAYETAPTTRVSPVVRFFVCCSFIFSDAKNRENTKPLKMPFDAVTLHNTSKIPVHAPHARRKLIAHMLCCCRRNMFRHIVDLHTLDRSQRCSCDFD